MPGGLTRVASSKNVRVVSMQRGGGSKDTWVMSAAPVDASFTLLKNTVTAADLLRVAAGTPSRVVENLFWFGRYEERCEDAARLLRLALNLKLQESDDEENSIGPVLALASAFGILNNDDDPDTMLLAAATGEENVFGLPANLRALERTAFSLRDRMSLDNLRTINGLIKDPVINKRVSLSEALAWLNRTITSMMTLSGFALDGMTRDDGWYFLSIGRRVERLAFQCLALQTAFEHRANCGLTWLLLLADSSVTYRSRYIARPEWLPVLDLLVLDGANPRSVKFQIAGIHSALLKLEAVYGACGGELVGSVVKTLENLDPARDLDPENARLRESVDALRSAAFTVNDRLTQRFFNHAHTASSTMLGV
jgi:uncharacterized alpha-E superfamily protein